MSKYWQIPHSICRKIWYNYLNNTKLGGVFVNEERSRYDLTSADSKIVGFDFQYFYFINELLKLDVGQSIGFEAKDDVHIQLPSDKEVIIQLIQLKHTVKKTANGVPTNLTEKDDDLWKSISNWSKVVCDEFEGRKSMKAQLAYLENVEFILATNKNISGNRFVSNINKFKKKKLLLTDIKTYLFELIENSQDKTVKPHIQDILNLNERVLESFLKKIKFVDTGDEIIESIKLNIQRKMIASNRVDDVFNELFSELKQDFFNTVKIGKHQIINFEEWMSKYTCIFENNRSTTLPVRSFRPIFSQNLFDQPFIKELIEIGDIKKEDLSQVAEFSEFMLNVQMNLEKWHIDGDITKEDLEKFHKSSVFIWKNIHRKSHRTTKSNLACNNMNSVNCLDDIRGKELKILTTEIGIDLSNGEFYYLSNEGELGWKIEWEAVY